MTDPQENKPLIERELGLKKEETREEDEDDDDTASTTTTTSESSSSCSIASSGLDNPRYYRVAEYLFLIMSLVVVITICAVPWLYYSLESEQSDDAEIWESRWPTDDDGVRVSPNPRSNPYTVGATNAQQALEEYAKNYKPKPSPKNLYRWSEEDVEKSPDRPQEAAYDWQQGVADEGINNKLTDDEHAKNYHPPQPRYDWANNGRGVLPNYKSSKERNGPTRNQRIADGYEDYYQNRKVVVEYKHFDDSCTALKNNLTISVDPNSKYRRCPNTVDSSTMDEATKQLFRCCQLKDFYMARFDSAAEDDCLLEYQDDFGAALYEVDEFNGDRFYPWMETMAKWKPQCPDQVVMRSMEQYC